MTRNLATEPCRDDVQPLRDVLAVQHYPSARRFRPVPGLDHHLDPPRMGRQALERPQGLPVARSPALADLRPQGGEAGLDLLEDAGLPRLIVSPGPGAAQLPGAAPEAGPVTCLQDRHRPSDPRAALVVADAPQIRPSGDGIASAFGDAAPPDNPVRPAPWPVRTLPPGGTGGTATLRGVVRRRWAGPQGHCHPPQRDATPRRARPGGARALCPHGQGMGAVRLRPSTPPPAPQSDRPAGRPRPPAPPTGGSGPG